MHFLVQTTHDPEETNMEVNTVKEGDAKIPLLRNSKLLNIDDKLMRFVPKNQSRQKRSSTPLQPRDATLREQNSEFL